MKIRSIKFKICSTALLFFSAVSASAQTMDSNEPAEFDIELTTPAVPAKMAGVISDHMVRRWQSLIDRGYDVAMERDEQVVMATIPLDNLFGPNSTSLLESAGKVLEPFLEYTRHYGKYKILLAVHSDDTGSPNYRKALCEQRVISLYEYFERHGSNPAMVFGYAMGHEQPLVDDNSRKNRALNRRLEVYIVPGPDMIANSKKAKSKKNNTLK